MKNIALMVLLVIFEVELNNVAFFLLHLQSLSFEMLHPLAVATSNSPFKLQIYTQLIYVTLTVTNFVIFFLGSDLTPPSSSRFITVLMHAPSNPVVDPV